ncbi:coiled-coil and C2 domain-containing protein 2A isoform X3 [Hydra vulgaris]|uniref:Coiled-coil and C2 domain-containing protein 2A isoform X3 n=1 Tax=Hydra vulgaris TaxID=6087 RepID=A0ABM4CXP7_HYDVU
MIAEKMRKRRAQLQASLRASGNDDQDQSTSLQAPITSSLNPALRESEDTMNNLVHRRSQYLTESSDTKEVSSVNADSVMASEDSSPASPSNDRAGSLSISMSMSVRERLRNRVKKQSIDLNSSSRKLRGLRDRLLPNRFDESAATAISMALKDELDPYFLKESIAATKEWKKDKFKNASGYVSADVALQFFIGEIDGEVEKKEETLPTFGEVAIDIEDSSLILNAKPVYQDTKDRLLLEEGMYHFPSSIPTSQEAKLIKGGIPRNLQSEGFYVGVAPNVPLSTLYRMENRILLSDKDNKSWFNEDGSLKRLANPLKESLVRETITDEDEINPLLNLQWGKAEPTTFNSQYIDEKGLHYYQIDIDVSMIKFSHQPLFSLEHVLESKLIQLYNQFILREKSGFKEQINNRLEALCASKDQLKAEIQNETVEKTIEKNNNRIHSIQCEICELFKKKRSEEVRDRQLLINIIETWRTLKKLRETQGYTNTPTMLKIMKEPTDKETDEKNIILEIKEQLESERAMYVEQHKNEIEYYMIHLLQWKRYKKQKKKLLKNTTAANVENLVKLADLEVEKPIKPKDFDEENSRNLILDHMRKYHRKPGEPILTPFLNHGAIITPTEKCPSGEQQRRAATKDSKFIVKVLFNNQEVSKTSIRSLSSDFIVYFGEILAIKILQWPESIKLQIYEVPAMFLLAELFAILPEIGAINSLSTLEQLEFSSDQVIQFTHNGVGSGVPCQLGENTVIPLTSGILYTSANWGLDENGLSMAPPVSATSRNVNFAVINRAGKIDLQKLLSWISNAKLDPNDPTNAEILSLAKMARVSQFDNITGPQYFRLNQLEKETEIVSKKDIDNNKRFTLIKLRDEGVPELKHYQMIPPYESLVPEDVFEEYENRINMVNEDEDEEYNQRKAVSMFLAKVREQVYNRSQIAKRQLSLEDVVVEEAIPDIGSLGARIKKMTETRRPLLPVRKERKKIGGQNLAIGSNVKVLINIVRAFNIPIRIESLTNQLEGHITEIGSPVQNSGYNPATTEIKSLVRPFVEVMFQGVFLRTSVGEGAWPNWNEDLILPFKPPNNDYSSDSLHLVKDKIFINLFDEVMIDLLLDQRERETNIHQRVEKRWLGSVEVPFSTVYFNSKVDGFIEINTPPILLGYRCDYDKNKESQLIKHKTLIQLFITIEPQLQPAPHLPEKFETNEDDMLVHNSQIWLADLRNKFPRRNYKAMVTDIVGKKVFLSRFIRRQKPPDELMLDESVPISQKIKLLSRFVSLIPFISDSVQFPDICDIWTTSDQFLQMLSGDEEEHAVLLCNYFLWLGLRAYLVLGSGVPEGSTAYVLCEEMNTFCLWNASTGESYELQNTYCPLISIGTLVDDRNIFANIQNEEHPSKLNFEITNQKYWRPFFSKTFPYPGLGSVQEEMLVYHPIDQQYTLDLSDKLERLLREKLMEWRPRFITKFNRFCTQTFKTLLLSMESRLVISGTDDHGLPLQQFLSSHELIGFSLQMPYTDSSTIVERVYGTGIHNSDDPDIEFALAVHVHPYPSGVLAIWIYIGRLLRKK